MGTTRVSNQDEEVVIVEKVASFVVYLLVGTEDCRLEIVQV